jgi:hypothetical protein
MHRACRFGRQAEAEPRIINRSLRAAGVRGVAPLRVAVCVAACAATTGIEWRKTVIDRTSSGRAGKAVQIFMGLLISKTSLSEQRRHISVHAPDFISCAYDGTVNRISRFLKRLFRKDDEEEVWASVVLLMRETPVLDDEALIAALSRAFKNPEKIEIIARLPNVRVLRIVTILVSVNIADAPYFDPAPHMNAAGHSAYDRAWAEQKASLSIDAPQSKGRPKEDRMAAYKVLMALAEQLWNDTCTGLYLPAEGVTAPSMGAWGPTLRWFGENKALQKS